MSMNVLFLCLFFSYKQCFISVEEFISLWINFEVWSWKKICTGLIWHSCYFCIHIFLLSICSGQLVSVYSIPTHKKPSLENFTCKTIRELLFLIALRECVMAATDCFKSRKGHFTRWKAQWYRLILKKKIPNLYKVMFLLLRFSHCLVQTKINITVYWNMDISKDITKINFVNIYIQFDGRFFCIFF